MIGQQSKPRCDPGQETIRTDDLRHRESNALPTASHGRNYNRGRIGPFADSVIRG